MENIPQGAWVNPKPTDWVLGSETAIVYEARVANWKAYLPTVERQKNYLFDSNMCVTYSGLNSLETQLMWMLERELLPAAQVEFLRSEGYLDSFGRPNFNEAFCAKLNGTTIEGNHLGAFWEGVRNYGVIPQQDWISMDTAKKWEDLMDTIPESRLAKGRRFLEMFQINYEWTLLGGVSPETLSKHVKHAPIHIAAPICPTWNTGIVDTCDLTRLQHATIVYGARDGVELLDFDHYVPFEKTLAWDYYIPYAIKGIIQAKVVIPTIPSFVHTFHQNLMLKERSPEVIALQKALQFLGFFKYPIATGYYGNITADAVKSFQYKYQLDSPEVLAQINGRNVGPKTRAKLNELLNK